MFRGSLSTRLIVAAVLMIAALAAADALRPASGSSSRVDTHATIQIAREDQPRRSEKNAGRGTGQWSPYGLPDASVAAVSLDDEVEVTGRLWASSFGSRDGVDCSYMTKPLCERVTCEHVGGYRPKACRPVGWAFRKSFKDARVGDVAIEGDRAAIKFSNGRVVELFRKRGSWWVGKLGPHAGRGFFD